jgi:serine/threonine protein kinase
VSDRILGQGTYGAVYLGQEVAGKKQMACKIVNLNASGEKHMECRSYLKAGDMWHDQLRRAAEGRKIALREIKILSKLSHVRKPPPSPIPFSQNIAPYHKPQEGFLYGNFFVSTKKTLRVWHC